MYKLSGRRGLVLIPVIAGVLVTAAGAARAAGGKIAFFSDRDGNNEIYLMEGDGTNVTRFTNLPGNDHSPDISPDGRKIVWASSRNPGEGADIYERNIDGSNERRLTTTGGDDIHPRYSPDGTKVIYSEFTGSDYDIRIIDLTDLSLRSVANNQLGEYRPAWSPGGSHIAFKTFHGSQNVPQITLINANGGGQLAITSEGPNEDPAWSSTDKIAFHSVRNGTNEIYVMDSDGFNQTRLTYSGSNREPAWKPDGSRIVFSSNRESTNYEIWTMGADGSAPLRLTTSAGTDGMPCWGPYATASSQETLTINDAAVIEGDGGTRLVQLTVRLSRAAAVPVSVNFETANSTAVAGADYLSKKGTVFFAPGETEKSFRVTVAGDSSTEGDESFFVNLSNPLGATLADGQGVITIIDNESFPLISLNTAMVAEGDTGSHQALLTASLSKPSTYTITVDYATVDGSATAGTDYVATQGTLTFAPGVTSQQLTVEVKGDIRWERDEAFTVGLSNPQYGRLAAPVVSNLRFNPANDHWYRLVVLAESWDTARTKAEALTLHGVTGHLATVTSAAEQSFLNSHYSAYEYYLGGWQQPEGPEPAGGWRWVTDEPFNFTNWNSGEPSNSFVGQYDNENILYAYSSAYYQAGRWNDAVRYDLRPYLVEFDTGAAAGLAERPGTVVITNDDDGPHPPELLTIDTPDTYHLTELPRIAGKARDYFNGGGIERVELTLLRLSDNYYWNGNSWVNVPVSLSTVLSGGPEVAWQRDTGLPVPGPDPLFQMPDGTYILTARAINADGKWTDVTKVHVVDATGPAVTIESPLDGAVLR